jgi:NAD(P)-dependent dehydrogenase (short-subunit alcohol dehydrogenase family)
MSDLIREAKESGIDLTVDKLDVTNPRDLEYIHQKYDIDILVSNAGIMEGGPIAEQPIDLIRSMFDVNVFVDWSWRRDSSKSLSIRRNRVKLYLQLPWENCGQFLMLLHTVHLNMPWDL